MNERRSDRLPGSLGYSALDVVANNRFNSGRPSLAFAVNQLNLSLFEVFDGGATEHVVRMATRSLGYLRRSVQLSPLIAFQLFQQTLAGVIEPVLDDFPILSHRVRELLILELVSWLSETGHPKTACRYFDATADLDYRFIASSLDGWEKSRLLRQFATAFSITGRDSDTVRRVVRLAQDTDPLMQNFVGASNYEILGAAIREDRKNLNEAIGALSQYIGADPYNMEFFKQAQHLTPSTAVGIKFTTDIAKIVLLGPPTDNELDEMLAQYVALESQYGIKVSAAIDNEWVMDLVSNASERRDFHDFISARLRPELPQPLADRTSEVISRLIWLK